MTELMQKALEELSALDDDQQDAFAWMPLEKVKVLSRQEGHPPERSGKDGWY